MVDLGSGAAAISGRASARVSLHPRGGGAAQAEIIAIGGIEDHVHVLLRLPATVAIATLVKQLKGSSSHLANHEVLPRGFKWQGGYSASSVSRRVLPIVRNYVLRQEEHHRDGTIYPDAEP
ncbi:MAG TPA: transposase [Longimicrobium sp.]|uniref:transposase n=1 Tax=Longimicrobium sp. TaxID=2029185 RepID=UPI002EDB3D4E